MLLMLSKSARAAIRLQGCCTRQICFFLLQNSFVISPSSENTQKDKAAIVILVPRAHDPFGLRQGSRHLAGAR